MEEELVGIAELDGDETEVKSGGRRAGGFWGLVRMFRKG